MNLRWIHIDMPIEHPEENEKELLPEIVVDSRSRSGGRVGAHLRVRYERKKTSLYFNPNTYTSRPTTNRAGNRFSHNSHSHEESKDSSGGLLVPAGGY